MTDGRGVAAPPAAATDRRLRADRRHPHRGARLQRRRDRLALRTPLRRGARLRPARRRPASGNVPGRAGPGSRGRRAPLPAAHGHAGDDLGGRRTSAHPHRGDGCRGDRAPAARDAPGAAPVGRGRSRRRRRRVRPPPRGAPPPSPRIRRDRGAVVCQWGSLAISLGCTPELPVEPGRPTLDHGDAGSPGHPRAGRGPPRTARPRRPGSRLGSPRRGRSPLAGLDRPDRSSRCRSATPPYAAC